jgi:hypothetical protein
VDLVFILTNFSLNLVPTGVSTGFISFMGKSSRGASEFLDFVLLDARKTIELRIESFYFDVPFFSLFLELCAFCKGKKIRRLRSR